MAAGRRLAVGAEAPGSNRWTATVLLPTEDPAPAVLQALSKAQVTVSSTAKRCIRLADRDARVNLLVGRRPGSPASEFVLGSTAMMRSLARRSEAASVERVCSRVRSVTMALATVVARTPEDCSAVAAPILASSRGAAFDLETLWMPSGLPAMTFRDRRCYESALQVDRVLVVTLAKTVRVPRLGNATAELWKRAMRPARSRILGADAIAHQVASFARFAAIPGPPPSGGSGLRQVQLAEILAKAQACIALESSQPSGLSKAERSAAFRLALEHDGLVLDEYGVYDGSGAPVFASWSKKLAPLPTRTIGDDPA